MFKIYSFFIIVVGLYGCTFKPLIPSSSDYLVSINENKIIQNLNNQGMCKNQTGTYNVAPSAVDNNDDCTFLVGRVFKNYGDGKYLVESMGTIEVIDETIKKTFFRSIDTKHKVTILLQGYPNFSLPEGEYLMVSYIKKIGVFQYKTIVGVLNEVNAYEYIESLEKHIN